MSFLRGLAVLAVGAGICLAVAGPFVHIESRGGGHYGLEGRSAGIWLVLAGLVCWVGDAWLRWRKDRRPWTGPDVAAAWAAALVFAVLLLWHLLRPAVIA
ncbi:MAG TPA: hypothetical protein VEJ18_21155 [Planctomycetota bacterium]|nr:hypothetical protein [Planctomycetota bacterium]